MKKKIISSMFIIIFILIMLALGYFVIFFIQNKTLIYSLKVVYPDDMRGLIRQSIVRCDFNLFNPEIVQVWEMQERTEKDIFFYSPKNLFFATEQEWGSSGAGGTTILNTTFPELLKMVKKDCSQFQKSKGRPNDENINWSYSHYTPEPPKKPEPEYTEEERKEMEELREKRLEEIGERRSKMKGFED